MPVIGLFILFSSYIAYLLIKEKIVELKSTPEENARRLEEAKAVRDSIFLAKHNKAEAEFAFRQKLRDAADFKRREANRAKLHASVLARKAKLLQG